MCKQLCSSCSQSRKKVYKYTVREYLNAKNACDLQSIIGTPSTCDLIKYVENSMIPNIPVTRQDILKVEDIFGPNIRSIKGKMTHTKQKNVQVNLQDIPQEIMEKHGEVTLAIDVMFINKIPFVMMTSTKDMKKN